LTNGLVHELPVPASGNKIFYDGGDPKKCVRGFGVRITANGALAFVLNYRIAGRERRLTIGGYPEWSVNAAREKAKKLRREVDAGHDPLEERIAEREAPTVNDLIERYCAEHVSRKRKRSQVEDKSIIRQWIEPEFGNRKVADIRHLDIEGLHRKITNHGTPVRANRAATLLSKMFSLAVRWEMRSDNPVRGLDRNAEERRARYLKGDEFRRLTVALAEHPNQQAANVIRLLLLSGARRGEVLGARWDQLDLQEAVWTKPSAHTKQRKEHRTPLSSAARQLLVELKASSESEWVFPSHTGNGPLTDIKKSWASICKAAGISGVRVHDLRHSYASILASAGLSLPVIGALLGHTQASTTHRYAHLFDDPLRQATERVGAFVMGNNSRETEQAREVVPIGRARR